MSLGLHSHCVTKLSHIIIQKGVVMASLNEYSEEEVARVGKVFSVVISFVLFIYLFILPAQHN